MAAPITHLVFAEMIRSRHFPYLNRNDFLAGTSFPDIRYLGVIERRQTHFSESVLTVAQLERETAFMAGMRLHAMVDRMRYYYTKAYYPYATSPPTRTEVNALKFLEDELLYDAFCDASWANSTFS